MLLELITHIRTDHACYLLNGDLDEHSTSIEINSVAKQNNPPSKCPIHNMAWLAYGTCTYAGSYMHPVHDKQETSVNVRGDGDCQKLRGQEILRSSNCTKKLLQILGMGGGGVVL